MAAPGYVVSAGVAGALTLLALRPPRGPGRIGTAAYILGFVAEMPGLLSLFLVASTVLAGLQGDLGSGSGLVGLALVPADLVGLGVVAARMTRARGVLERALRDQLGVAMPPAGSPLRSLARPLPRGRRDVERIADVAYAATGRAGRLDLYRHRSGPANAPVFVHWHGGYFVSGGKNRESLPLLYRLAADGWLVISANYSLRVPFPAAHQDARRVLAWVRDHAADHGGDPDAVVVAGNSAGAHLAVFTALTAENPSYQPAFPASMVLGVVGLGGYYGSLDAGPETSPANHLRPDAAPALLIHGERDSVSVPAGAREFAVALAETSRAPVVYAELPGAQHNLDYFHSPRADAVADAVRAFTSWAREQRT